MLTIKEIHDMGIFQQEMMKGIDIKWGNSNAASGHEWGWVPPGMLALLVARRKNEDFLMSWPYTDVVLTKVYEDLHRHGVKGHVVMKVEYYMKHPISGEIMEPGEMPLFEALLKDISITIGYADRDGNVTAREIRPVAPYISTKNELGVIAYCGYRKGFRIFLNDSVLGAGEELPRIEYTGQELIDYLLNANNGTKNGLQLARRKCHYYFENRKRVQS